MHNNSYYERQMDLSSDVHLANDIAIAIIGEIHAYNLYARLAELANNEQNR